MCQISKKPLPDFPLFIQHIDRKTANTASTEEYDGAEERKKEQRKERNKEK